MKSILLLFLCFLSSFAIGLQFKQDSNITISQDEIDQTIAIFLAKKIRIDPKDAALVVYDNRLLANAFLQSKGFDETMQRNLLLSIEEQFGTLYINQIQDSATISDDILESYFNTHKEQFTQDNLFKLSIFRAKDFDTALELYLKTKEHPKEAALIAKDLNISIGDQDFYESKLATQIKTMFKDTNSSNYLTPPFPFQNDFVVIYVKEVRKGTASSFKDEKEKIKKVLAEKRFLDTKLDIIKELKSKQNHD